MSRSGLTALCILVFGLNATRAAAFPRAGIVAPRLSLVRLWDTAFGMRGHHLGSAPRDSWTQSLGAARGVLTFEIGEPARTLYVQVDGRIQIERIDVLLANGESKSVDAFGEWRSDGLFELMTFGDPAKVAAVRVIARAGERRARVGIRVDR